MRDGSLPQIVSELILYDKSGVAKKDIRPDTLKEVYSRTNVNTHPEVERVTGFSLVGDSPIYTESITYPQEKSSVQTQWGQGGQVFITSVNGPTASVLHFGPNTPLNYTRVDGKPLTPVRPGDVATKEYTDTSVSEAARLLDDIVHTKIREMEDYMLNRIDVVAEAYAHQEGKSAIAASDAYSSRLNTQTTNSLIDYTDGAFESLREYVTHLTPKPTMLLTNTLGDSDIHDLTQHYLNLPLAIAGGPLSVLVGEYMGSIGGHGVNFTEGDVRDAIRQSAAAIALGTTFTLDSPLSHGTLKVEVFTTSVKISYVGMATAVYVLKVAQ